MALSFKDPEEGEIDISKIVAGTSIMAKEELLGLEDGIYDGFVEGDKVGPIDGWELRRVLGISDGLLLGSLLGHSLGFVVGYELGTIEGALLGQALGTRVGISDG